MVFSSIEFIYFFLPIFLLIYYIMPDRAKNACLFIGSVVFYGIGSIKAPQHIGMFAASIILNYVFGLLIEKYETKVWLVLGVGLNVAYLALFKYILQILPIGISFYTFQAISYLCDVRWRKCRATKSFVRFGTYLSMFPQLIAGPIVQYPEVARQIYKRKYSFHTVMEGLQVFIIGLGSKVLLANKVGNLWSQLGVIGYDSITTQLAWLGLIAYTFQIYFDFLGYSLMAIGLGKMLGFELPKNFDNPYLSVSMTEFWRRWHMTLGSWFREYVYIPLGGNRCGKLKLYRNLFIVWMLTGIWHGAGWNFVLWGFVLFVLIAIEKAGLKTLLEKYRVIGHLYMMAVIPLSWAVFAHPKWEQLILFFKRLFGIMTENAVIFTRDYIKYGKEYGIYLLLCLLFCTTLPQKVWAKIKDSYIAAILLSAIFVWVVYCLYIGMDNPFLYYQF